MNFSLKSYSIWEFGQRTDSAGNPHQEDSLFPPFGHATDGDRLFIVCDGMGGHSAGDVASEAVCSAMADSILGSGRSSEGQFTDDDLAQALKAAYDALDRKDDGDDRKMGTTMTLLKLHSAGATIAHIGDSRVYHFRPGATADDTQILYATEDHSLVNQLVRAGVMTHEEAMVSGKKNVITRAMQPGLDPRPQADVYHTADIQPGDWFLLCSDGILEHPQLEDGSYLRHLFSLQGGSPKDKVETLLAATINNSDNHTAILVQILDVQDPSGIRAAGVAGQGQVTAVKPAEAVTTAPVTPQAAQDSKTFSVAPQKTSKSGLVSKIIIGVVILLALLGGYAFWHYIKGSGTPDSTGELVVEEEEFVPVSDNKEQEINAVPDDKETPGDAQQQMQPVDDKQTPGELTNGEEMEIATDPEKIQILEPGSDGEINNPEQDDFQPVTSNSGQTPDPVQAINNALNNSGESEED